MFNLKSPFSEVLIEIEKLGACAEAMKFLTPYADGSLQEAIEALGTGELEKSGWLYTASTMCKALFEDEVLRYFMRNILNPDVAFMAYIKIEDLTEEDDAFLESIFLPVKPTITKQYISGELADERTKITIR